VSELQHLLELGVELDGVTSAVEVDCFVCDVPARAYIKNVKGHSGYYGCDKCCQEGEYVDGRITFPLVDCVLRTDLPACKMRITIVGKPLWLSLTPTGQLFRRGLYALSMLGCGNETDSFLAAWSH